MDVLLLGRQTETKRDLPFTGTHSKSHNRCAGPDGSQESRTHSKSPMFVAGTQLLRHHLQLPRMALMLSKQVREAPSEKVVPRQRCEAGGGDNHAISGKKIFQRRQQ